MYVTGRVFVHRARAEVRRAERRRMRRLRQELAAFSSPADRLDLEATLDRYPEGQTRELRTILAAQDLVRPRPWRAIGGI